MSGFTLNCFCDVNVLGVQTTGGYVFPNDEDHRHHLMRVGRTVANRQGVDEVSYRVHPAFYPALEIVPEDQ